MTSLQRFKRFFDKIASQNPDDVLMLRDGDEVHTWGLSARECASAMVCRTEKHEGNDYFAFNVDQLEIVILRVKRFKRIRIADEVLKENTP